MAPEILPSPNLGHEREGGEPGSERKVRGWEAAGTEFFSPTARPTTPSVSFLDARQTPAGFGKLGSRCGLQ